MPYTVTGVGFQRTDTSRAAAFGVEPKAKNLRERVLEAIKSAPRPVSTEEIAVQLRKPESSVQPRTSELRNGGLIKDSGERGETKWGKACILWQVVA